jgi:transcriptional regulator GlxA family with amidase domain
VSRAPKNITFAILNYPGAMQSAVWGWQEMVALANRLLKTEGAVPISCLVLNDDEPLPSEQLDWVMVPPCMEESAPRVSEEVLNWLNAQSEKGALMSSACAGAFVLAESGLLKDRHATTHWALADAFRQQYPEVELVEEKILVDEGNVITAGGLMSWVDLGLSVIARFTNHDLVTVLGKQLVVDSAPRQQKYYQRFYPILDHGDHAILDAQNFLSSNLQQSIKLAQLCAHVKLTERTFQRRFSSATGYSPQQYLNQLRVQVIADALENTTKPFESIALSYGYQDASACRKLFKKIVGLSPKAYRQRFRQVN